MIDLLITLLILVIIAGIFFWLIGALGLPEPWGRAAQIIAVLICLVVLVSVIFGGYSLPHLHLQR